MLENVLNWYFLPESKRSQLFSVKQTTKRSGLLKMLIIGGNDSDDVISMESYCPYSNKWTLCAEIKFPVVIREYPFAVFNETVYVSGEQNVSAF